MRILCPVLQVACAISLWVDASAQIGGLPPSQVVAEECTIGSVFNHLQEIKANADCLAGCATSDCGPEWYPGEGDLCNAACGAVFEPFWDSCGTILVAMEMGGVDGMQVFYDQCLLSLYPPGSCGSFCNGHTFDCYLAEVNEACCDEGGINCDAVSTVPETCPVGCALVRGINSLC